MTRENPFNPSFGQAPKLLLNQQEIINDYLENLTENSPYRTSLIASVRGSGKTTFLTSIQQKLNQSNDWLVVPLIIEPNILNRFENKLKKANPQPKLKSLSANIFGIGAQVQFDDNTNSALDQIEQHLKQLKKDNKKVLIVIDEIVQSDALTHFLKWYQIWLQQDLPVYLLAAGLPKIVLRTVESDGLTFLLRSHKLALNPLNEITIQNSFQAIFSELDSVFTFDALEYLTTMIDSYPYAYQLVGYHLWRYIQNNNCHVITPAHMVAIKPKITEALYENVYYRVYDDMTAKEKDFIEAMLQQNETANLNEIHSIMGSQNITAQYRRRLIKQGVIRSTGYGRIRFNLPFFRDFLIDLSR